LKTSSLHVMPEFFIAALLWHTTSATALDCGIFALCPRQMVLQVRQSSSGPAPELAIAAVACVAPGNGQLSWRFLGESLADAPGVLLGARPVGRYAVSPGCGLVLRSSRSTLEFSFALQWLPGSRGAHPDSELSPRKMETSSFDRETMIVCG